MQDGLDIDFGRIPQPQEFQKAQRQARRQRLLEYGKSRAGTQSHCYFIGLTYDHLLSPVTPYHT